MPRATRVQVAHGIYHITARGNRRQEIFVDAEDQSLFLKLFESVVQRRRWRCHGYCLMPNHYHLIVETPDANLSAGMQYLNGAYAQAFNHRRSVDGHLFQGRFHSVLVESTWHFLDLTRYLAVNPVIGGLCLRPSEWQWGSYISLVGKTRAPSFIAVEELLRWFGPDVNLARQALRDFVGDSY